MDLFQIISAYVPANEAEARDRELMLYALAHFPTGSPIRQGIRS